MRAGEGASPALPVAAGRPERLVYLGSPEIAVAPLMGLIDAGFDIPLVVTGPDRRRGRRGSPVPTPVGRAARAAGLRVSHRVNDGLAVGADLGVIVAFGRVLRRPVLERLPMVNLHFSLLPRWRGAAPVERALLAGDEVTGVCVMAVEEGLDTGGVYSTRRVPIGARTTAEDLRIELVSVGTDLLVRSLREGLGVPVPQGGEVTYAAKLDPEEFRVDWNRPAVEIDRWVRVGGVWTMFRDRRLRILEAVPWDEVPTGGSPGEGTASGPEGAPGRLMVREGRVLARTGGGALELVRVQAEGKGPVEAAAWARGARLSGRDGLR